MNGSQISIIICTRNRPDELKRCLSSIADSDVMPLEILVVDQSSDDRTKNLVLDYAREMMPPVRHLRVGAAGQTKARNAGLRACRGDIVVFTDDDCVVDRRWTAVVEEELSNEDVACVSGKSQPASHAERPKQAMLSTLNHGRRIVARGRRNPITIGRGNNMAFRKSVLMQLGGFNERIGVGTPIAAGDDLDMFSRTLQARMTIVYTPASIVLHDQPDDWRAVVKKKRAYSLSSAAVLGSRFRNGDVYAGSVLAAKLLYEFAYLFCGGMIRLNRKLAVIGWNSFIGSLSGIICAFNSVFHNESRRLYRVAETLRTLCLGSRSLTDERDPSCMDGRHTRACSPRKAPGLTVDKK